MPTLRWVVNPATEQSRGLLALEARIWTCRCPGDVKIRALAARGCQKMVAGWRDYSVHSAAEGKEVTFVCCRWREGEVMDRESLQERESLLAYARSMSQASATKSSKIKTHSDSKSADCRCLWSHDDPALLPTRRKHWWWEEVRSKVEVEAEGEASTAGNDVRAKGNAAILQREKKLTVRNGFRQMMESSLVMRSVMHNVIQKEKKR
jgi:hypothetical protein